MQIFDVRSPLEYLSLYVFDFTTYDSDMDELFARKALEVCLAITEKTTYEYIQNEENYKWYLLMINMPFFQGKLDWGTSIRGAWWSDQIFEIELTGFFDEKKIVLTREEWKEFIRAISDFTVLFPVRISKEVL